MPNIENITFDVSGLKNKTEAVNKAIDEAIVEGVDFGVDEIMRRTIENLAGIQHPARTPAPTPGELPVTQISGKLHGSIMFKRVSPQEAHVFQDKSQAGYGAYVHEGTRKMAPRPFMREAAQTCKQPIMDKFDALVKEKVGKVGL